MNYHEAYLNFAKDLKLKNYALSSRTLYLEQLKPFERFLNQRSVHDIRKITHQDILDYQEEISKQPVAPETRALRIRTVKRLFEHLTDHNHLLLNPCDRIIETPKNRRLPRAVLTQKEIKRILSQPNTGMTSGIRNRAVLELFYSTAIRIGEMVSLTVYDIDFRAGLLHIRSGKGAKARVVPIGKEAIKWTQEYITKIRPRQNRLNPGVRSLFLTRQGRPITHHLIRCMIKDAVRKAKITKHVTAHTFRHTCATHLIQNGADILTVSELLGHKHLNTTVIYTRVAPMEVKAEHIKTHPRERKDEDPIPDP